MSKLTIYTSGSTRESKVVTHDWDVIKSAAERSIKLLNLTSDSRVLNLLPNNVIGFWTLTAYPAMLVNANLVNMVFDPYQFIKTFNEFRPTNLGMINRMFEVLNKTKSFDTIDMSCVECMFVGSDKITQEMIDTLLQKGVKKIINVYGMTEFPPPIYYGINSLKFTDMIGPHKIEFTNIGECVIDGFYTKDIFTEDRMFSHRDTNVQLNTWKTNIQGTT